MAALRAHRRSPGVQQWALSAAGNLICNHDGRAGELMRQGEKDERGGMNLALVCAHRTLVRCTHLP